jgi:hypothetical protein
MSKIKQAGWVGAAGLTALALALTSAGCGNGDNTSTPPEAGSELDTGTPRADAAADAKASEGGTDAAAHDSGSDAKPGDSGPEATTPDTGTDAAAHDAAADATLHDAAADATPQDAAADATLHDAAADASDGGPGEAATADASDAGGGDGGCSGATPVALTVKNYLQWCSVAVANGTASTLPSQTVCVAAGAVNVAATALVGFQLGPTPWHDTVGDHDGSGDPGALTGTGQAATSTAMVDVTTGSACVWACCPFTNGTGCTNLTNQCP